MATERSSAVRLQHFWQLADANNVRPTIGLAAYETGVFPDDEGERGL